MLSCGKDDATTADAVARAAAVAHWYARSENEMQRKRWATCKTSIGFYYLPTISVQLAFTAMRVESMLFLCPMAREVYEDRSE
jgi:hypothetical protein